MRLVSISLRGFRNHSDTVLEFSGGTNIILGDNGQGKTNILEAISYLCLTKSFYASSDTLVLGFDHSFFEVKGLLTSDSGVEYDVRVTYVLESKEKAYFQNKRRMEPLHTIIGRFPVVILSPEHAPITFGGPVERRKFLDIVLSQASASYAEDILEYRRIVRQRNKILLDAKIGRMDPGTALEPWDEQLARVGSRVTYKRKTFIHEFHPYLVSAYRHITDSAESPAMKYIPSPDVHGSVSEEDMVQIVRSELRERRWEEIHLGTSLVGPHRDEIAFTINDKDLRKYASQGQHKTYLIALKIAEFYYLKEHRGETPIVLLDDVFSELDPHRTKRVLHFLGDLSQTFITSTTPVLFDETFLVGQHYRRFFVSSGAVEYENV